MEITLSTVIGYKKIFTWFLISLLILQEIFRIPYSLSSAKALEIANHENIISLMVEEKLYKKIQSDIEKYAQRIQSVLPQTRTVILTFPENAHPVLIASANERLYYFGLPDHGNKTQKLIGTILIGDIPLPTVHKKSTSFLSIFPYVDFDEPNFIWNGEKNFYEYLESERKNSQPDIWHSVIAPHTGDIAQDAQKIQDFFTRVYQYDNKQGDYADLGLDPQVFYADSVRDSRATSSGALAAYEKLFVPNQEHFRYNRYTKDFAQYLYENYLTLMKGRGIADVLSFSKWRSKETSSPSSPITLDSIGEASLGSSSFLANASDISTRIFSRELIPGFVKTLSEKYVGDISRWVHQTGRYYDGYSKVRVDTMPELIQERDTLSSQMLQEANDAFERVINEHIDNFMSIDIPVLVSRQDTSRGKGFTYTNYFLGQKALTITEATQCTILRGSSFGNRNTVAEMNHGYYIQGAQDDVALITKDAQSKIRCDDRVTSYWGGNTAMNLDFSSGTPVLKSHKYDDFSQPIYDPAGGKKTTGQSSPFDCLKTDLLLDPYVHKVSVLKGFKEYKWPEETSGQRYSCGTDLYNRTAYFGLDPTPETEENIFRTLSHCTGSGNTILLGRDGKVSATCTSTGAGGTYKLISSLIKHTSPDLETYGRQLSSLVTPNLPIDEERYVVYIDRDVKEKRFDYPNVFDIDIPIGATDAVIKQKIQQYLTSFDTKLIPGKKLSDMGVFAQLVPKTDREEKISLAQIVASSPDLENNLVASLRWKNLPTAMKYQQGIMDALRADKSKKVALFGDPQRKYEISYMGGQGDAENFIIGYHPDADSDYPSWYQSISDIQNTYTGMSQESSSQVVEDPFSLSQKDYDAILGTSPSNLSEEKKSDASCQYDNAVVIWKWPSAIQCWLKNLFKTRWELGKSDFSFDWSPYISLTFGNHTLYSTEDALSIEQIDENVNQINDNIENNSSSFSLQNILSSYSINPRGSIRLESYLQKRESIVDDDMSKIDLSLLRIANLDSGKIHTPTDPDWESIKKQSLSISGSSALQNGRAVWVIQSLSKARMSFEFQTTLRSEKIVHVKSSIFTLSPESKFPPFTLLSSTGALTPKTVRADDEQGVNILFQSDNAPPTVDVVIRDYVTNRQILSLGSVPVEKKNLKIGSPAIDPVLHKAGKYIITLTSKGVTDTTDLFVVAGAPKKILTTLPSILLAQEKYVTEFIMTDTWGNTIDAHSWKGTLHTSQPILSTGSTTPSQDFTFPLSQKFQFQPLKESTITFDISAQHNQETIKQSSLFTVLEDIQIEAVIDRKGVVKVGQKLPVEFIVKTKGGTPITQWDTAIRIGNKGTVARLENALVSFSGGRGTANLLTGTRSGTTSFYFSDISTEKKIGTDIIIAPDVPDRLTFSGPKTLLARSGQSQILSVNIFDTYGNYIHPATVDVRIESDREDIIEPLGKVVRLEGDTYGVQLKSRGYPGRVLLRGALWENGKKSTKTTVENVWEVQILPMITSQDIAKNTWNALTYVLLGGPFGQFVTKHYFAGSLLFSPNTQALSISTLLDSPREGLFSVSNSGSLNLLGVPHLGTGLQTQWLSDKRGLFAVSVSDKRLGGIAKVIYPRLTDTDRIFFSPSVSSVTVSDDTIFYQGVPISTVKNIFETPLFSFTFVPNASNVRCNVLYQDKVIGVVTLSYIPRTPSTSGVSPNTFSLEPFMSDIVVDSIWGNVSSADVRGMMVLQSSAVSSYVGGPELDGYSAYPEKYGMGWTGNNLSLLQFSSGESWAQSQQAFSDYLTITLGDALIKLPEYRVDSATGFDTTIGIPVYHGSDTIEAFDFADINSDEQKDIVVTDTTNTLSVALSKKDGKYLDMGEFLSFENAREGSLRMGDFFGDGYADTIYVDASGRLRLVSHDAFSSQEIDILSDRNRDVGQVTQVEVFDMDHDSYDDIITLDTLGQLSILYGTPNKKFIYQFVDHVFDFAFAEKALFSGAAYFESPAVTFPDSTKTQNLILRSQQEQIHSMLFTSVAIPDTTNNPQNKTQSTLVGTQMSEYLSVDTNAGSEGSLSNISEEYNNLARQYGNSLSVSNQRKTVKMVPLLKAPFIQKNILDITKTYSSLEKDGSIIQGARIQGSISLKNTSSSTLSNIILLENFPSYLQQPISSYTLKRGGSVIQKAFLETPEGGLADLRDIALAPGETIELVYTAQFAAFSFGTFDVGYLEDTKDPLMNVDVTKEKILTIHPEAKKANSLPEKSFYSAEEYGDIRINPNQTCGGPLFLWRSHNTFARTYQKTLIVRDIKNPDTAALALSNDPLSADAPNASSVSQGIATALARDSSSASLEKAAAQYASTAQSDLDVYNQDLDGDIIPDRYDEDTGDVFSLENSGNTTQITIGLGKLDKTIDSAVEGVETFMSGLSCGFGDPGCIAQPMNWAINIPGNTITALGYAVPGINRAPLACYKDVRCGVPLFSFPTASYPFFWPPNPKEAGGMFDMGANSTVGVGDKSFKGGYGTSQFRFFLGGTLTGAIAAVLCFGPNNAPTLNFPGLFPIAFEGNCIYATQPLTQCSDDGSDDMVSELETDEVGYVGDIQITDGDSCGFFEPVSEYPEDLTQAVSAYLSNPTSAHLDLLRIQISENAALLTGSNQSDQSLLFASSSPYTGIQATSSNSTITYPEIGSGNGIIQIALDSTSFDVTQSGPILDIPLKSISAFPRFIMDWYHNQMDEIVSSFGSLPDIKIFLPDLGSGFADGGWISEFNTGESSADVASPVSPPDALTPLDTAATVRDDMISGIQGGIGGIQSAFEYLSLLPMVDVHPEIISLDLPWMDRSAMQSWLYRNEAILAQWEALPQDALGNAVNSGPLISSIRSNIETVRSYMTLPEQLQNLFYLKEKFLYEILKNVHAIQNLMGGWMYDNGERFKTWVETFILVTKLWDLWQVLIDIFTEYEDSCAVCHNEQWNLQEWLWIVISVVVPPIPVIKMPRWPDIELDFSDINLGIDIAYPVFNFSFYPLDLPDMPSPSFSGLNLDPIPQLPPLPDLNLDFEIPTIQLPKLPNLPPAPLIPELSQSITVVLKIFKIVTLIQCLYRQIPLSPEWYVGTKIAHATDRQGYLPIDFLNVQMPSVVIKWVDAIRISTHVELTYDVDYIIEMIQSVLEPLSDFPRDLSNYTGDIPSSVDIDLETEDGARVQTSSLQELPGLIGELYRQTLNPKNAHISSEIQSLEGILTKNIPEKATKNLSLAFDPQIYRDRFEKQANSISQALEKDIDANRKQIADLSDLAQGIKKSEDIAWLQDMNPSISHLATSPLTGSGSALIDLVSSLKNIPQDSVAATATSAISDIILPTSVTVTSGSTASPSSTSALVSTATQLKKSKGLYITQDGHSKRLNYFYEDQERDTVIRMIDDDRDGDKDIFYTIGNTIYRKENHSLSSQKVYIKDSPRTFTVQAMMREFFGLEISSDLTTIPHDMQIFLREYHTPNSIESSYLIHTNDDHQQFDIFSTWGQSDPRQARYRVDAILEPKVAPKNEGYSILTHPVLSDIAGKVTLYRKKIYRTLLPSGKYVEEGTDKVQDLSADFVIRAKKIAYTKEKTTFQLVFGNEKKDITLRAGEVLMLTRDSKILLKSGSLILPSDDYENDTLDRSDIDTPLFLEDVLKTSTNGTASVGFSDGLETDIFPEQTWSLVYHTGIPKKIQEFSLPVISGWYYVVTHDASSLPGNRISKAVLFDAHPDRASSQLADTLPTTLDLNFDTPTEIDFQSYFPIDTIAKVEVTGLSEAFWKQATATKILFQTSQENQSMTLRVTSKEGVVYMYPISLVTKPAKITIKQVDSKKSLTGTLSQNTTLPVTIQSFINNKTWTLSAPLQAKDKTFTTSFAGVSPEWNVSYGNAKAFSFKRDSGSMTAEAGLTIVPDIKVGSPLAIKTLFNQKEIARVVYQAHNLLFQQVVSNDSLQKNTLSLMSPSLRLEPAITGDAKLAGGAYIVDAQYRPIIAFDTAGVVRYLDSEVRFTARYEGSVLVFVLSRGGNEIGKLSLSGDMLTVWEG